MGPAAAGSLVPKPGSLAIKRESMKCLFLLGHNRNWLPWQKEINTTNYYNFPQPPLDIPWGANARAVTPPLHALVQSNGRG